MEKEKMPTIIGRDPKDRKLICGFGLWVGKPAKMSVFFRLS